MGTRFASRLGWLAIISLVAVNAALVWNWMRLDQAGPERRSPTLRAAVQLPPDTALAFGRGSAVAVSPDGARIVYAAESKGTVQLHSHALDRFDSTPIPGTEGATDPFFSPDGRWLGFFADEKLKKIPVEGGDAVTLADAPAPRGQAWGTDDAIVLVPRDNTGLWRVSANGGKLEPVTTLVDGEASHRWPHILPAGRGLLYTIWGNGWDAARIAVQPPDGAARRVIVTGGGFGRFVAETADRGFLIYARAEGLIAVPFDLSQLRVTGQPVLVGSGVITNLSGGAQFAVSTTGSLAYVSETGDRAERALVWVARNGTATPATTLRAMSRWYDLSPDDTRVARYRSEGPTRDVRVEELATRTSTRVTAQGDPVSARHLTDLLNLVWSADGKHIAYAAGVPMNLFRAPADGSGQGERLTTSPNPQGPSSWAPDGRTLAFVELDPLSGGDIQLLALDESRKPAGVRPFLSTPFDESAPVISPDGRWLAYQSNESGRYEIYVQPFPEGGQRSQVSTDEGIYPRWSGRGDELFFRSGAAYALMTSVPVKKAADFQTGTPRVLFDGRRYGAMFDVSSDGRRFLMPLLAPDAAATRVNVVVNWLGELGRRPPQ